MYPSLAWTHKFDYDLKCPQVGLFEQAFKTRFWLWPNNDLALKMAFLNSNVESQIWRPKALKREKSCKNPTMWESQDLHSDFWAAISPICIFPIRCLYLPRYYCWYTPKPRFFHTVHVCWSWMNAMLYVCHVHYTRVSNLWYEHWSDNSGSSLSNHKWCYRHKSILH